MVLVEYGNNSLSADFLTATVSIISFVSLLCKKNFPKSIKKTWKKIFNLPWHRVGKIMTSPNGSSTPNESLDEAQPSTINACCGEIYGQKLSL